MRVVAKVMLVVAALFAFCAIWSPGAWLQFLLTALLLMFIAASILGPRKPR